MKPVFLIASGAYVESELEAEFGRLPPAFLPLGNRRLFVHQHEAISAYASRILLSLPEGFEPDPVDAARLRELNIETVLVPEHLTLGQSLVYVINISAASGKPLAVLHGDTLLKGLNFGAIDAASIEASPPPDYRWGAVRVTGERLEILPGSAEFESEGAALTGFFSFSDTLRLVQAITRRGGGFLPGLADYSSSQCMLPLYGKDWFDFGHAGTYHRSRRRVTTEREFNRLATTNRSVTKSGTKPLKIEAEARWFEQLPTELRIYAPAYLGRRGEGENFSYALEYLHLPTLSDLFVFGRLRREAWDRIFDACDEVLSEFSARQAAAENIQGAADLYLGKTLERLDTFARSVGLNVNVPCRFNGASLPSIEQMATLAASAISGLTKEDVSLVHGDFCFSNVLYDTRADIVRVIDPRGLDAANNFSTYGDIRYDIAKLYHSVIGRYDHIVAGNFQLARQNVLDFDLTLPNDSSLQGVGESFLGHSFAGKKPHAASAPAIAVLLFFSMLPLHSDNQMRQLALLANGMRLFSILDGKGND